MPKSDFAKLPKLSWPDGEHFGLSHHAALSKLFPKRNMWTCFAVVPRQHMVLKYRKHFYSLHLLIY